MYIINREQHGNCECTVFYSLTGLYQKSHSFAVLIFTLYTKKIIHACVDLAL